MSRMEHAEHFSNYIIQNIPLTLGCNVDSRCLLYLPQISSELVASNPNLGQGFALRGLVHLAEGQQQFTEQRLKTICFLCGHVV